jgi:capsular polysaccharide biosynthesis protein
LYKIWGAEASAAQQEYATDTCFETAVVGKISTIQKEYLLSRSEDPGYDLVGDGWASQYYMQPQILHAFRDAVTAAVVLPERDSFQCSQAGSLKLLYVVRKHNRKITNEEEIMDAIRSTSENGWCTLRVSMESYSLEEQIQLWHDADVAIATHGASGAGAIFMRPGARFIELQGNNWDRRWALDLATLNGVHTMVLRSQTSAVPHRGAPGWVIPARDYAALRDQDVTVDVESFKRLLENIGQSRDAERRVSM